MREQLESLGCVGSPKLGRINDRCVKKWGVDDHWLSP